MTEKRSRSAKELQAQFDEQWGFLWKSCDAYDRGDESEAKRIAATLRLLLHDTRNSKSLIGQLGLLDVLFFDSAENLVPANVLPTFGLVHIRMNNQGVRFVPPLNRPIQHPVWLIPFEYWWSKKVINIPGDFALTRRDLVLLMADQDGGAHIDPMIDERYFRLTRENAMGHTIQVGAHAAGIESIETASMRQIADEVMKSLIKPWRMIPPDLPDEPSKPRTVITKNAKTGEEMRREVPVRNMCMCNSGFEYKECHAKGGRNEGRVVPPRVT